jgi:hypothetical protein
MKQKYIESVVNEVENQVDVIFTDIDEVIDYDTKRQIIYNAVIPMMDDIEDRFNKSEKNTNEDKNE